MQNDILVCCVSELTCSATWIDSPWIPDIGQFNVFFFQEYWWIYSLQEVKSDNRHTCLFVKKKKMNVTANSRFKSPMVSWFVWSPALFCYGNVCAQKITIGTKLTVSNYQTDSVKHLLFLLSQNHLFDYPIIWNCLANKTIRY